MKTKSARTKMKGALTVFLCSVLVLLAAACGNGGDNGKASPSVGSAAASSEPAAESSAPMDKEPVTITFTTFNAWWASGNIQKAIELYQAETGNKVDAQIFPDDQFVNIINTKLASGDTPDVFAIWPNVTNFNKDQLEPLDGPWTEKIDLERAKKFGYASIEDGKYYSAPYGANSIQGLIYNKDLFQQAGISGPFKTYQEFLDACEALKKIGVTPLVLSNKEGWTTQILFYTGSNYLAAQDPNLAMELATNKAKPSEKPALIDMVNRVLALRDKDYTNDDHLSTTIAMAEQALVEGKTAMIFGGDWLYADFDKNYKDKVDSLGMTAVNWGDDAADLGITKGGSGNGLFVPKNAKNKETAIEFIDYVMSDAVMKAMYEIVPGVNDAGIETKASSWDAEMQGLIDSGTAKATDNIIDAIRNAVPGSGIDVGDFSGAMRSLWSGKSVDSGLNEWYAEYSKLSKVKKVPGF